MVEAICMAEADMLDTDSVTLPVILRIIQKPIPKASSMPPTMPVRVRFLVRA